MKRYRVSVPITYWIGTLIIGTGEIEIKAKTAEDAYKYIQTKKCWDRLKKEKNFKYKKYEPTGEFDIDIPNIEMEEIE